MFLCLNEENEEKENNGRFEAEIRKMLHSKASPILKSKNKRARILSEIDNVLEGNHNNFDKSGKLVKIKFFEIRFMCEYQSLATDEITDTEDEDDDMSIKKTVEPIYRSEVMLLCPARENALFDILYTDRVNSKTTSYLLNEDGNHFTQVNGKYRMFLSGEKSLPMIFGDDGLCTIRIINSQKILRWIVTLMIIIFWA